MARTKSVLLRLSEEEYARLKQLAGREPMNAYLRRVAGLLPKTTADIDPVLKEPKRDVGPSLNELKERAVSRWFCSTCNTLSTVPRCASNPSHKVTPG